MRRIGIFYPFGNMDSIPCLVSTITLLARAGYEVDVFTRVDSGHVSPEFSDEKISLLPAQVPPRSKRPLAYRVFSAKQYRTLQLHRRHNQAPYVCLIGVDPHGLIEAGHWSRMLDVPVVYFSLELLLSYELTQPQDIARKAKERAIAQTAAFSISLGEERAEVLTRDNGLAADRSISIPNAALGAPSRQRSSYLRDRYGLTDERTRIILISGELAPWAGLTDMAVSMREWPDNWILFCHSRRSLNYWQQAYIDALTCLAPAGQIIFSGDPLPRDVYPELVRSADVGVAFYVPESNNIATNGDNTRFIGHSSGKLAYYLQNGLPVIVNETSAHQKLIDTYGCGVVCAPPSKTVEALSKIFSDYESISDKAISCFQGEYDIGRAFAEVLDRLSALGGTATTASIHGEEHRS
jgi:hypothetical protein